MGILNVFTPQNMLSGSFWYGSPDDLSTDLVAIGTTRITMGPFFDNRFIELTGSFQIDVQTGDVVGGTIDGFSLTQNTVQFTGTGFDVLVIDEYIASLFPDGVPATDSLPLVDITFRGDDEINGSGGADTLSGRDGNDAVSGAGGDDDVNGNLGNDTMSGGAGADFVRGGQNEDIVHGDDGDDWHVNGNIGNDLVFGDGGNDTMFGGQGNDTMDGGDGEDRLDGNLGDDLLFGASGADRFAIASGGGDDRIGDFAPGLDKIEIQTNLNGTGIGSFAALQGRISSNGQGGSLIDLGGGNSLVVAGIGPGGLGANDFLFL